LTGIPIDFAVDKVKAEGGPVRIPKFAKAILRLSKMLASEKRKLGLIYPNPKFPWTPYCVLEAYFFLAKKLKSRSLPKVLVITDTSESIQSFRRLTNEFGTPFVDYVYSGFIDRGGFHRIKTLGSTRGSQQAQIDEGESQVFFCKPVYLDPGLDPDFVIIEDVYRLMRRKNFEKLQTLLKGDYGILGVLGSPSPYTLTRFEALGVQTWGWTEDSLRRQMVRFRDTGIDTLPEARFPSLTVNALPLAPQLKTLVDLASNSYQKTANLRRNSKVNDPIVDRIMFELRLYFRRVLSMPVPLETFEKTQEEAGLVPLRMRLELTKSAINSLPQRVANSLEIDGALNALRAILSLELPKWPAIHAQLLQSYKRTYLVASDTLNARALSAQLGQSSSQAEVISPENPGKSPVIEALVTGLTGSAYYDCRILKASNAHSCEVIAYPQETAFVNRVIAAREALSKLVAERVGLVNSFKLDGY
jgi:hypothetical protein